jgi:hypothetical protein
MSQHSLAAQRFWRDLIASCTRAGEGDLDTDEMAFITFELALGLLALDATREQLLGYLDVLRSDLEKNGLRAVNAALRLTPQDGSDEHTWSWTASLSGLSEAHPSWRVRQLAQLIALSGYTPSQKFGFGAR